MHINENKGDKDWENIKENIIEHIEHSDNEAENKEILKTANEITESLFDNNTNENKENPPNLKRANLITESLFDNANENKENLVTLKRANKITESIHNNENNNEKEKKK